MRSLPVFKKLHKQSSTRELCSLRKTEKLGDAWMVKLLHYLNLLQKEFLHSNENKRGLRTKSNCRSSLSHKTRKKCLFETWPLPRSTHPIFFFDVTSVQDFDGDGNLVPHSTIHTSEIALTYHIIGINLFLRSIKGQLIHVTI